MEVKNTSKGQVIVLDKEEQMELRQAQFILQQIFDRIRDRFGELGSEYPEANALDHLEVHARIRMDYEPFVDLSVGDIPYPTYDDIQD